ncbi:helix-turn-helix domain-containing protein [Marinimicrococcus flavescens]|uniref:Helix-turn-helix domain-containing protein n=1 Tax=Marinimicrococcus flavescens TaxID=3031815 RepID=A0AAP4D5A9_9PROT|nr:helix-turn-helix domain-containing protein [Marinimicrococcus flavescens]
MDTDRADEALGQRIRHLRKARGLSLKEVAGKAGFSIGLISQIERGISSPSVKVLTRIANALQVNVGSLFDDGADHDEVEGNGIVVRRKDRRAVRFRGTGISKELLTPQAADSELDIFMMQIEPDGTSGDESYMHDGVEAGIVLEGAIWLTVDGEELHLREGDGFRFASQRPHSFRGGARGLSRVLWVNARRLQGGGR